MAREFVEAEHPRWPRGSGDKSGEFRDAMSVGTATPTTDWLLRAAEIRARRRWRQAEPGEVLDPEYRPGNWTMMQRADRLAELTLSMQAQMQALFPDSGPRDIEIKAARAAAEALPEGSSIVRNGPHTITVHPGPARVDMNLLIEEADRLLADYPPPDGLRLAVVPQETMIHRNAYAETIRGTGTIRIKQEDYWILTGRPGSVGDYNEDPDWFMPTSKDLPGLRYVLTHEWGHALDPQQPEVIAVWIRAQALERRKGLLSSYGKKNAHEGYAEAFAEWVLSGGRTKNPVVKLYAREFGWRRPSGNGDQ